MNRQARAAGLEEWHNWGAVTIAQAAESEAKLALANMPERASVVVLVRDQDGDDLYKLRVNRRCIYSVEGLRGEG
jgi:hypothetical protein